MGSFKSFNLTSQMLNAINEIGYTTPSRVQELVIPHILKNESLVVTSETGSGKTHAFLIPIIQSIKLDEQKIQAIIVAPTRELARQTYGFAREFIKFYPNLKIQLLTSQVEKSKNEVKISKNPHIIVATPGRLLDLGVSKSDTNLSTTRFIVLDEADMLMDLGFLNDINEMLENVPNAAKLVFSATINNKLARLIERFIGADHIISLENMTNSKVEHFALDIRHQEVNAAVASFIRVVQPFFLLIFASKKEDVNKLYNYLKSNGFNVALIHGDLEKRERKNIMKRIKNLEFQIVVCSDMAARGLDIENVSDVLNVDLPKDLSFYFHRAGRTGRFYKDGRCYTFYNDYDVEKILKLKEQGVEFVYKVLKNDELRDGKEINYKKKHHIKKNDVELERDIKRAISETKKTKVKPGYKKAVKNAVEKVKRKHHRKMIRENIRKERVKRYIEEARKNG